MDEAEFHASVAEEFSQLSHELIAGKLDEDLIGSSIGAHSTSTMGMIRKRFKKHLRRKPHKRNKHKLKNRISAQLIAHCHGHKSYDKSARETIKAAIGSCIDVVTAGYDMVNDPTNAAVDQTKVMYSEMAHMIAHNIAHSIGSGISTEYVPISIENMLWTNIGRNTFVIFNMERNIMLAHAVKDGESFSTLVDRARIDYIGQNDRMRVYVGSYKATKDFRMGRLDKVASKWHASVQVSVVFVKKDSPNNISDLKVIELDCTMQPTITCPPKKVNTVNAYAPVYFSKDISPANLFPGATPKTGFEIELIEYNVRKDTKILCLSQTPISKVTLYNNLDKKEDSCTINTFKGKVLDFFKNDKESLKNKHIVCETVQCSRWPVLVSSTLDTFISPAQPSHKYSELNLWRNIYTHLRSFDFEISIVHVEDPNNPIIHVSYTINNETKYAYYEYTEDMANSAIDSILAQAFVTSGDSLDDIDFSSRDISTSESPSVKEVPNMTLGEVLPHVKKERPISINFVFY